MDPRRRGYRAGEASHYGGDCARSPPDTASPTNSCAEVTQLFIFIFLPRQGICALQFVRNVYGLG